MLIRVQWAGDEETGEPEGTPAWQLPLQSQVYTVRLGTAAFIFLPSLVPILKTNTYHKIKERKDCL